MLWSSGGGWWSTDGRSSSTDAGSQQRAGVFGDGSFSAAKLPIHTLVRTSWSGPQDSTDQALSEFASHPHMPCPCPHLLAAPEGARWCVCLLGLLWGLAMLWACTDESLLSSAKQSLGCNGTEAARTAGCSRGLCDRTSS